MAKNILDLSQPIDVPLLDATVAAFCGMGAKEEVSFNRGLVKETFNACVVLLISRYFFIICLVWAPVARLMHCKLPFYCTLSLLCVSKWVLRCILSPWKSTRGDILEP